MTAERGGKREEEILTFLRGKRWFGEKAREIRGVRLLDTIPVAWSGASQPFAVSRVEVTTDDGSAVYQLFSPANERGEAITGAEALDDPAFLRGIADAWQTGCAFERDGTRWIIGSESRVPLVVPADGVIAPAPGEQSNSSIILNDQGILKLYRRLEPGIHPDVEVTRFLTIDRAYTHVPALLGTIRFEDPSGVTIAGMLQEFVAGATDAWRFTLQRLRDGAAFTEDAMRLGTVIRSLHQAMASGDPGSAFEYQRATGGDVQDWLAGARRTIARALDALGRVIRLGGLPPDVAQDARRVAERGPIVLRRVESVAVRLRSDAGAATRIHGDLHLGQILRSAAKQYLVLDFEGEPARPFAERRARSSPLRDVAGMLRSFSYAALSVTSSPAGWEDETRAAFLRGYLAPDDHAHDHPLVPASRDNTDALVTLFETEKAFYELQYELDHRPEWAWIPLRGISRLAA